MSDERWRRVRALFAAAQERRGAAREEFLADACAGEPDLRAEVERLLAADSAAGSFLDRPPGVAVSAASATTAATLAPGTRLGPYEITGRLGSGGMGEVFRARDTRLERTVAIKVLPADLAADPTRRRRFEREARAIATLSHPHICALYDVGREGERDFLVMEYVEGETLADVLARGPLPVDKVLRFGAQIAEALGEAHRHGIIHRDLKPANVMLTRGGVKLLDFGLARLFDPDSTGEEATHVLGSALTERGMVLGTLPYMAPEQLAGDRADARTDVFALGSVLYEMTTGRRAFAGKTRAEILAAVLHDEPPPLGSLRPGVPAGLERVVRTCLAKEREARWQTAREVALALGWVSDPALSGPSAAARAQAVARRGGWWIGVAAAIVVLLATGGWLWWRARARSATAAPALQMTALTTAGRAADQTIDGSVSISPDGKYVSYAALDDHQRSSLWMRLVGTQSQLQIVPPAEAFYNGTTFSRDGAYVYYVSRRVGMREPELWRVPVIGGTPSRLIVGVDSPIGFSPDGKHITFVREVIERQETLLMTADADGGHEHVVSRRVLPLHYKSSGPSWSPDGQSIAIGAGTYAGEQNDTVVAVSLRDGSESPLTKQRWSSVERLLWLHDGSGLVLTAADQSIGRGSQVWLLTLPEGEARVLTRDVGGYGSISLGITEDGRTIATIRGELRASVWVVPAGGGEAEARQVTSGLFDGVWGLAWTPDARVVYATDTGDEADLAIVAAEGGPKRLITQDPSSEAYPAVTRDGRYLLYQSNRDGSWAFWRSGLDGNDARRLAGDARQDEVPVPSADSRWIYFASVAAGRGGILRLPMDGGQPVRIGHEAAQSPAVSPDGRWLAYLTPVPPRGEIHLIPVESSAQVRRVALSQQIASGHGGVQWLADRSSLCYTTIGGGVPNIWCQPLDGAPPQPLTHFSSLFIENFALAPDGKRLAVSRGIENDDLVLIRNFH